MTTATDTLIKNVGILLRISREAGEGRDTLLSHRTIAERYCKNKGYNFKVYEEVISGAKNIEEREALNSLLEDVQTGLYDAIFVISTDRISRDSYYLQYVAKVLADHEVLIITPEKVYDLNGDDRLMFDMLGAMSSQELRLIAKRQKRGKREGALRGEFVQGVTPYGYYRNSHTKKLEIKEAEAEIVRMIFDYAISGYSLNSIVDKLSGYRTRSYVSKSKGKIHEGKPFTLSQVNTILKNTVYCGTITYQVKNKQKQITETIVVENSHEAIISPEDFEKAELALSSRISGGEEGLAKRTRSKGQVLSILKDLVFCNECGRKIGFRRDSKNPNKIYLKACSCGVPGVNNEMLMAYFQGEFKFTEEFFTKEWKKSLEGTTTDNKEVLEQQVQELLKQQQKLNKRLKNINLMRADGELTKVEAEEMRTDTDKQLSEVNSNLNKLQKEIASLDTEKIIDEYQEKLNLIQQVKETDNIIEANRLLKLIADKIYYFKGEVVNGDGDVEDTIKLMIAPK